MSTYPITLIFADGASRRIDARAGDSVVFAAEESGLTLLTDCSNGQCGTCMATLVSGDLALDAYDRSVLSDADRDDGSVLPCVSRVTGACALEFPYDVSEATADELEPIRGTVVAVTSVADETIRLDIQVDDPLVFQPGQYVRIRPEGLPDWRSYSMANTVGSRTLVFYARVVEGGLFSTWLASSAAPGAIVELSHPHGSFFLRDEARPRLFVAGGTGLAPFLSMLEAIAHDDARAAIPTTLLLGVRSGQHLFGVEQLDALRAKLPSLDVRYAAETAPVDRCHSGYATDLIGTLGIDPSSRVYLCGPPPMVEAGRAAAEAAGFARRDVLCERFN